MDELHDRIDRLASRHIAKCLDYLGDTLAPVQVSGIKRAFRFFAEDIKTQVIDEDYEDYEDLSIQQQDS